MKALEQRFRRLAAAGKLEQLKQLLNKNPRLNINAQGEESGRTALHWAAFKNQDRVIAYLFSIGIDRDIKDLAGFTALELAANPIKFTGYAADEFKAKRQQQIIQLHDTLREFGCTLVYVQNLSELEAFIIRHQELDKIGFILEIPNIFKATTFVTHVVPIFFHRSAANQQDFFMLDSGHTHFIPLEKKPGIERRITFSPFVRQASTSGCFRDAILVLVHCFFDPDFFEYCERHRKNFKVTTRLTEDEISSLKTIKAKTVDEMISQGIQFARFNYHKATQVHMEPTSIVYCLTALPNWMTAFIEHFGLMRALKGTVTGMRTLQKMAAMPRVSFFPRYSEEQASARSHTKRDSEEKALDFNTYRHADMAERPITRDDIKNAMVFVAQMTRTPDTDTPMVFIPGEDGRCEMVAREYKR